MAEESLLEKLKSFISSHKSLSSPSSSEAAIIQTFITPFLGILGWNYLDEEEVCPQFPIENTKVDLALIVKKENKVLIEVKKPDIDLEKEDAQDQLLQYCYKTGDDNLAILTNGNIWYFYLPNARGSWKERRIFTIENLKHASDESLKNLIKLLSKDSTASGKAYEFAKEINDNRGKIKIIDKTLPKVWNKIITEPDDLLVELIIEETEKICGYRPDTTKVEEFIHHNITNKSQILIDETIGEVDYTNKKIKSFIFLGNKYVVNKWKDFLIEICKIMHSKNAKLFDNVLTIKGKTRSYFSKTENNLKEPREISGTKIYVETNLSANSIVKVAYRVIELFNQKESDLKIETN